MMKTSTSIVLILGNNDKGLGVLSDVGSTHDASTALSQPYEVPEPASSPLSDHWGFDDIKDVDPFSALEEDSIEAPKPFYDRTEEDIAGRYGMRSAILKAPYQKRYFINALDCVSSPVLNSPALVQHSSF